MEGQRAERTRALIQSYRYSVNRLESQARRVRPAPAARESPSPRQINVVAVNGSVMQRRPSRPTTPAIIDKEALDKEMMDLKKLNKTLQNQNHKLKTNNISLKQQVINAKKDFQEKPKNRHLVRTESAHTRRLFFELNETKQENAALKQEMQHARLQELKTERQENAAEIKQLKEQLQQEKELNEELKRILRKKKESHMEDSRTKLDMIQKLEQQNRLLRQNKILAANRIQRVRSRFQTKKVETTSKTTLEKKAKDEQIESLKKKLNEMLQQCNYLRSKLEQQQEQHQQLQSPKPAQECKKCAELKFYRHQNKQYAKKIAELSKNTYMEDTINVPTIEQSNHLRTFITLRLSNLYFTLQEAIHYFFDDDNKQKMKILSLITNFNTYPFGQMSDRYTQILVFHLCLKDQQNHNQIIVVKENKSFPLADIKQNFRQFIGEYTVPSQSQRQESTKQVEALFKNKIIRTIIDEVKKNIHQDQRTINYHNFYSIMKKFDIDEDCVVEMVRRMVQFSIDLNRLDCQELFSIFEVEEAYSSDSLIIQRNSQENQANLNPEIVPSDIRLSEDIFTNLDPNKLSPTQQDFPI